MRSSQGGRIDLGLSVGPRPSRASCLRFSRNCKVAETSNLVCGNMYLRSRVTKGANLRSKGQRSRILRIGLRINSSKVDRFTSKQGRNDHRCILHIVEYFFTSGNASFCQTFVIFICNYLGGPHVAVATWSCSAPTLLAPQSSHRIV